MRGENVDNAAGRAVGEIAVETVDIPTAGILIIHPGRTLELVNAEGMRKESRFGEVNGAEDRKHLRLRETVVDCDIPKGPCGHESALTESQAETESFKVGWTK